MYHEYVLIQKIQENARLKVYIAHEDCINWTYETNGIPNLKTDTPFFPLIIEDKTIQINEKSIGKETSCYKIGQNKIRFSDDYSVPGGFLVCITGPIGYMPTVVKFKKKPMISDYGNYTKQIPGHFEVLTNRFTKQASLLMHILERTYFGISIDFDKKENGFNRCLRTNYNDPFDITVSLVDGNIENATVLHVSKLIPDLNQELVGKLVEGINELIEYLKRPVYDYDSIIVPPKIKEKLSHTICSAIAISSSITTLVDSYGNNGFVSNLIKALFSFFS